MLRNRCVRCDHVIEAPDEQRGKVVVCPRCEATNVLRSPEDEQVETDLERAAFLRRLEGSGRGPRAAGAAATAGPDPVGALWGPAAEGALASDLVLLAGRRLRDIGDYLLLFAYGLLLLAVVASAVLAVWGGLPPVWRALAFAAGAFLGVLAFVSFKFMSDAARALADLGALARSVDARLARLEEAQAPGAARVGDGAPVAAGGPVERSLS